MNIEEFKKSNAELFNLSQQGNNPLVGKEAVYDVFRLGKAEAAESDMTLEESTAYALLMEAEELYAQLVGKRPRTILETKAVVLVMQDQLQYIWAYLNNKEEL